MRHIIRHQGLAVNDSVNLSGWVGQFKLANDFDKQSCPVLLAGTSVVICMLASVSFARRNIH